MKHKVTILTAMWNRPRVSELFCMSVARMREHHKKDIELTVHAAVTGTDSIAVCQKHGVSFVVAPNTPLGDKWNIGMMDAMAVHDPDYFMIMGDDDIAADQLLEEYMPLMDEGVPYFGVNALYFYDTKLKKAGMFRYRQSTAKLVGCGRMISRRAVQRTAWKMPVKMRCDLLYHGVQMRRGMQYKLPQYQAEYLGAMQYAQVLGEEEFELWEQQLNKSLDNSSEMNLLFNNYMPTLVRTKKPLITDVKTKQNLWAYNTMAAQCHARVEGSEALWFFSEEERKYLDKLN